MSSHKKLDAKQLDKIVEKMIDTVQHSKDEIFQIGEQSRQEHERLMNELTETKTLVNQIIHEADKLEIHARLARQILSDVNRNFTRYSEKEIRETYEKAHELHMKLAMIREQERQLRIRRDELERRLAGLKETIERAEHLVGQITVVLNYLNSDFRQVGEFIEGAKQKQEFGLKIIEAQEEERKRLSREIHDGPAQMLAHVMMRSDLIERILRERGTEQAIQEIRDFKKMVRSALYEVRRIIYDLRPMALDDLGLIPTLRKYLQTVEEYNKETKISFIHIGQEMRLPDRFEVAVFRLVQESVQNALKHADATEIQVKIEMRDNQLFLMIKDNGKGFDITVKKENAFGLIGMKERVELLEGKMKIQSQIGIGTTVFIHIPFKV
ncbi:sensor histidine kinase [Thermaerobacillus caldiproteolyticus]|uniref:Signal transduction histidine-protein kinase/phosphatase DegS n=1 Tax=Thermaerobacillus caldiproteolyticus TaxID=247480 RepID=A0A7V9Z5U6_9BACL|nr:sensor histidine kinase [Anoxybacillus caldiproteolyticus]MBA2874610.1 two-component system sensor histidine kinase DegS [Anoxybacillus caldiproteolyticus]QPA30726.1 sensor histidine kinase [Anoxybacillus caldiproteolyticus]